MPSTRDSWISRLAWLLGLVVVGFAIYGSIFVFLMINDERDPRCRVAQIEVLEDLADALPTETIAERGFEVNSMCTSKSVIYANTYTFLNEEAVKTASIDEWNCEMTSRQEKASKQKLNCNHEGVDFELSIETGEVWQNLRELRINLPASRW